MSKAFQTNVLRNEIKKKNQIPDLYFVRWSYRRETDSYQRLLTLCFRDLILYRYIYFLSMILSTIVYIYIYIWQYIYIYINFFIICLGIIDDINDLKCAIKCPLWRHVSRNNLSLKKKDSSDDSKSHVSMFSYLDIFSSLHLFA